LKRRLVVVSGNKVASLGYSQILKVLSGSPVASHNLFVLAWLVNVVYLARLTPEIFAAFETEASHPVFLSLRSVLSVELASIHKEWQLHSEQLFKIPGVVEQLVRLESCANSTRAHLKDWDLGAVGHMNLVVYLFNSGRSSEVVNHLVFNCIPIRSEDAVVIWEDVS